jgi:nitrite reductase/ring-hydroxylating ferredoxin subunit
MAEFIRACRASDVGQGEMKQVNLGGGVEVVVANVGGAYCAFGALCTHEAAPLAEGELDGDLLTCPWHFTEFNVRTGEVVAGLTDEPIPVYEVRVDGDEVLVKR